MTDQAPSAIVATIQANASRAAMAIAIREARRRELVAQRKAAAAAIRNRIKETPAYANAAELRQEIAKATIGQRKEIADWMAEAKRDEAVQAMLPDLERLREQIRTLDGLNDADCGEHAQMLMPFAREVGA